MQVVQVDHLDVVVADVQNVQVEQLGQAELGHVTQLRTEVDQHGVVVQLSQRQPAAVRVQVTNVRVLLHRKRDVTPVLQVANRKQTR